MKHIVLCLALFSISVINAQLDFGIKAGLNYNQNGDLTVSDAASNIISTGGDAKTGYHVGIWSRIKVPALGFYVRPELVYTATKSQYRALGSSVNFDMKKIDVPILFGKKFFGVVHGFIGPSFQFILDTEIDDYSNLTTDDFSLGLQLGAGVDFGPLGLDLRWERGLSSLESKAAEALTSIEIDSRANQIIFSAAYKF